jgi:hypothetical protein
MAEPSNVEKLKQSWSQLNNQGSWLFTWIASTILDTKIPVMNGKKDQKTSLRTELAWLPDNFKALHNLNARFRAGKEGHWHEGDLYGIIRRSEFNTAAANATVQSMTKALAAVSGGESFDEDKLMAGIKTLMDEQFAKVVDVNITVGKPEVETVRGLVAAEPAPTEEGQND